jgi:peptide/nickel transport system substrate-binding protein
MLDVDVDHRKFRIFVGEGKFTHMKFSRTICLGGTSLVMKDLTYRMNKIWGYLLFAGLVALVMSVAACSSDDDATAGDSSAGITKGGTLKVGMLPDHISFDPPNVLGLPDIYTAIHAYDTLLFREADLTTRPALATSWEFNEDASVWTFQLRENVYFNSYENGAVVKGKEFTSEDVIFTINRMYEVESPTVSTISPEKPTMIAVGDHTVRFEFSAPNATLLQGLVKYQSQMTPSNIDPAKFAKASYGTGLYIITDHIAGERTTWIRNPDYWMDGLPYPDDMLFLFIPSPEGRAEALKAGTIDMIADLEATSIPGLQAHPDTTVQIAPGGGYMNLAMIVTEPPFDNVLVRKAVQAATDRQAVLEGAQFGLGAIAYDHPVTPTDPMFNPNCKPPDYDPVLAKKLLADAGYPDGIDLTLYTSTAGASMVEMATVLKESFKPAGINLEIVVMPEDGYWAEGWMIKPFTTVWWGGRPPYEGFNVVYRGGGSWNETFYANPKFDALLNEAMSSADPIEQKRIYGEMQCIAIEDVPRVVVVFRPVPLAIRNDVKGSAAMWDATISVHNVWLDR